VVLDGREPLPTDDPLARAADVAAGGGGATIFTALCRSLARIGQGPSAQAEA
jgi:hypothetical protein